MYDDNEVPDYPENEFMISINEIVEAEVKRRIEDTVRDLENARNIVNQYSKSSLELNRKVRELENNLKIALAEKEKEVKREMFGGLNVGDYVYVAVHRTKEVAKCVDCGGLGKVEITFKGKEAKVDCPTCNKKDYWQKHVFEHKPKKMKVTQITYKSWNEGKNKNIRVYLDSDSEYDLENIFLTEEECQKHCDEENAKEQEKHNG